MSEAEEVDCLVRARLGDREAFGRLAAWHRPAVVAAVRRLAGDLHAAEDIAQEATLRALRGVRRMDGQARFGHWLCRIARNIAVDRLRGARRERLVELDADAHAVAETPPPASTEADAGGDVEAMWRAIAALPVREQQLLLLRFGRGLSYAQIARELGSTPNVVKTAIWRSRARCFGQRDAK